MTLEDVQEILKTIKHPTMNQDIVSLHLIRTIQIYSNILEISLAIEKNSLYAPVANAISKALKPHFLEVRIMKANVKKPISFTKRRFNCSYAKKILAITGSKGGVGKSTIAANLALNFSKHGLSIGIVDADICNPSIPHLLHVNDGLLQWNSKNQIIPKRAHGLQMMSSGLANGLIDTPFIWDSSTIASTLAQFFDNVDWQELDILIIDLPSNLSEAYISTIQEIDLSGALFVTTPHTLTHKGLECKINLLKEFHVPIIGVVENMSSFLAPDSKINYNLFGESQTLHLCKKYQLSLLAQIPFQMGKTALEALEEDSIYEPLSKAILSSWN
jgi:ATP-binding protein involved in chromosome partitioning